MDPFTATILKESALIVAGFAAVGILVALIWGFTRYTDLHHAMTLNMIPPQVS